MIKQLLAATVIVILSATAHSQEHIKKGFSVRMGNVEVVIPPPENFEEASTQFERVKQKFTATESPTNDMVAVFLPASICEQFRQGQEPNLTFYTKVSVLKAGRETPFSTEDLASVASEFRNKGVQAMDPKGATMKAQLEHMEQALSNLNSQSTNIDMSKPVNLGEFDVRPNVYSVLLLFTLKITSGSGSSVLPLLAGMNFIRVKNRLVYLFTYRRYESKADVETLTSFSKKWNTMVLAAN
jgi:hypothetical protein